VRKEQGNNWCGYYLCELMHALTHCGKTTTEDLRVCPNHSYYVFLIIMMQWINILSFIFFKMIDDANQGWSSPCGSDNGRVGAAHRIHYERDPLWKRSRFLKASSTTTAILIDNLYRQREGLSILVVEIQMIVRYICSTCDHDICIFVNIIISKYLYYMIDSDFLLFTYIF